MFPWINQRIKLLVRKNHNHWNCSYFINSGAKAVAPDGSLYLSSADALFTPLSHLLDTLRLFLQKHEGTNTIYWPSLNAVHASEGFAPFNAYWPCYSNTPSLWFDIFNRLTTWAPKLQLLRGSAEIWVQFCSCKVLTHHKISSTNLLLTMLTITWWQ